MEQEIKIENPDLFPLDGMYAADAIKSNRTGVTLRDYFAAKILNGMLHTCFSPTNGIINGDNDFLAKHAYEIADAMLKARSKQV